MPLLVQGFGNYRREAFGIETQLIGCVLCACPQFCTGFSDCSSPAASVVEMVEISNLSELCSCWTHLWP